MEAKRRFGGAASLLIGLVLLLSVSLRTVLSSVNREANDPHLTVSRIFLRTGHLPVKEDCFECYQPKLFHYVVSSILQRAGAAQGTKDTQIVLAQRVNLVAGVLALLVLWLFLRALPWQSPGSAALGFALAALNPQLIGISSQATNDAFIILFSSLTLYSACLFFRKETFGRFLLLVLSSTLAVSSKSSGVVTAVAVMLALLIRVWIKGGSPAKRSYPIAFCVSVLAISFMNPLNQYVVNWRLYGSPILTNLERPPFPDLLEKTYTPYAGVLSVQDALLTFRYLDLLKSPQNDRRDLDYATHRNSLWTQLYGRAHSVHFDNWPPSWGTMSAPVRANSRASYVLALLPTVLILTGFAVNARALLAGALSKKVPELETRQFGLSTFVFLGYIAFIVLYALQYRVYTVMKTIFIYPALLAFVAMFVDGYGLLYARVLRQSIWLHGLFQASILALLVLYINDLAALISQLSLVAAT